MMKIYDISQEVFGCRVYPGDPAPEKHTLCSMENGELYNLTSFRMCAHNGTHIDAPRHFIKNGKAVDELPLESFVGMAYVTDKNCLALGNRKKALPIFMGGIPRTLREDAQKKQICSGIISTSGYGDNE